MYFVELCSSIILSVYPWFVIKFNCPTYLVACLQRNEVNEVNVTKCPYAELLIGFKTILKWKVMPLNDLQKKISIENKTAILASCSRYKDFQVKQVCSQHDSLKGFYSANIPSDQCTFQSKESRRSIFSFACIRKKSANMLEVPLGP